MQLDMLLIAVVSGALVLYFLVTRGYSLFNWLRTRGQNATGEADKRDEE